MGRRATRPAGAGRTFFKAIPQADEVRIFQCVVVDGREQVIGPVATFDVPDGDAAGVARARAYLAFLNARAGRWPYAHSAAAPAGGQRSR